MIDKIGGLNPLNNVQNIRKTDNAAKVSSQTDSISVSKEAVEKAEAYYLDKIAAETPNVRADRIAEVKGMSFKDIESITAQNTKRLFKRIK